MDAHGLLPENLKALTWRSCFQTCWSFSIWTNQGEKDDINTKITNWDDSD